MKPFKFKTKDSALSFFVNQLDNLDKRFYMPLQNTTWSRDIKLRSGITMANESTSFIQSLFASGGTLNNSANGGLPFLSGETTAIPGISIDGQRVVNPLHILGREVSYTSVELERSAMLGQPIDAAKMDAFNRLYQLNTDQMVYVGAVEVGATGLINNASVATSTAAATGTGSATTFASKTPAQILTDINALLTSVWLSSAYAVCPGELRVPPTQYGLLAATIVSSAGNMSVLKFLSENSITNNILGRPLNIQPLKWCAGAGTSSTDRMVAYTNEEDKVRFPMVPVRRETPYYQGIRNTAPYIWAFGHVEIPYIECMGYMDGI